LVQASELAIAVAIAVVMAGFGSFLIFTAPLSADFQCRLLGSPQGGRYWRFTLTLMRGAGVFAWLLAVAFVLLAIRSA